MRFISLAFSGVCAAMAGVINVAYFRSFNPVAGQFRELDAIAAVIIGGGSIFGGYGTIIGALAGAAVITLIRALLQLKIITGPGGSFVMPQHWVNVFIGLILIAAVLIDIWLRQQGIFGECAERLRPGRNERHEPCRMGSTSAIAAQHPIIEMRGISKAFGAVQALKNVDFGCVPAKSSGSSATIPPASRP